MKLEFSKIFEGWRNHLIPPKELKDYIKQVSKERLSHCIGCQFNTTPGEINGHSRCQPCGCWLEPKSKCLSCNCGIERYNELNPQTPLALKWNAVATIEEDTEIDHALKQEDDSP